MVEVFQSRCLTSLRFDRATRSAWTTRYPLFCVHVLELSRKRLVATKRNADAHEKSRPSMVLRSSRSRQVANRSRAQTCHCRSYGGRQRPVLVRDVEENLHPDKSRERESENGRRRREPGCNASNDGWGEGGKQICLTAPQARTIASTRCHTEPNKLAACAA